MTLFSFFCISDITDSENAVRQLSQKSHFKGPFNKQHGKRAQALLKSASHHLYDIHWLLVSQLSRKKSLLFTCKILVVLVHTLAADEKYLVLNRENLTIPIQMQLSRKQIFFAYFYWIFKSSLNSKHFEKKMTLIAFVFWKISTPKTRLEKCLKSPVSEDPLTRNMADVP